MASKIGKTSSHGGAAGRRAERAVARSAAAKRAGEYVERRERWRGLVTPLVAAAPGDSFSARCEAVGHELGVTGRTVRGYVGGESGAGAVTLPDVDGLARICRDRSPAWNPMYVLDGPPHPERVTEAVPRAELAHLVGAHLASVLDERLSGERVPGAEFFRSVQYGVDGSRALADFAAHVVEEARNLGRAIDDAATAGQLAIALRFGPGPLELDLSSQFATPTTGDGSETARFLAAWASMQHVAECARGYVSAAVVPREWGALSTAHRSASPVVYQTVTGLLTNISTRSADASGTFTTTRGSFSYARLPGPRREGDRGPDGVESRARRPRRDRA